MSCKKVVRYGQSGNQRRELAMKNPNRIPILSFLSGVLLVVLIISPVVAGTESLITINTTDSDQQAPSIYGDWITWEDTRDGSWDIYVYNIVTGEEKRITPSGAIAHDPAQSNDNIVWQDYRNGNYDIYVYNLSTATESRITSDPADQSAPVIDGNQIVWQDQRNGNYDIYQYNLSSLKETLITPGAPGANKKYPVISGNLVVWQDYRNSATKSVPVTQMVRLTVNNPYCRNETPIKNSYNISLGSAPIAVFTSIPESGFPPVSVSFSDTSLAATAWNWSFGDGSFSDLQNPTHVYAQSGTYSVLLNASNPGGIQLQQKTFAY